METEQLAQRPASHHDGVDLMVAVIKEEPLHSLNQIVLTLMQL